jgi:hypothetical protein
MPSETISHDQPGRAGIQVTSASPPRPTARCRRLAPGGVGDLVQRDLARLPAGEGGVWSRVSRRTVPSGERERMRTSPTCAPIQPVAVAAVGGERQHPSAHPIPWCSPGFCSRGAGDLRVGGAHRAACLVQAADRRRRAAPPAPCRPPPGRSARRPCRRPRRRCRCSNVVDGEGVLVLRLRGPCSLTPPPRSAARAARRLHPGQAHRIRTPVRPGRLGRIGGRQPVLLRTAVADRGHQPDGQRRGQQLGAAVRGEGRGDAGQRDHPDAAQRRQPEGDRDQHREPGDQRALERARSRTATPASGSGRRCRASPAPGAEQPPLRGDGGDVAVVGGVGRRLGVARPAPSPKSPPASTLASKSLIWCMPRGPALRLLLRHLGQVRYGLDASASRVAERSSRLKAAKTSTAQTTIISPAHQPAACPPAASSPAPGQHHREAELADHQEGHHRHRAVEQQPG